MDESLRGRAEAFFRLLQDRICARLSAFDAGAEFREDRWNYRPGQGPGRGGGITRVLENGAVFEKGGVNFSAVEGMLSERLAARLNDAPRPFFASGLSLVIHPRNPWVPTVHMNVRYLELAATADAPSRAWFGGGADLTPYYLIPEDAAHFHHCLREACDRSDPSYYPRFKKGCDEYFHLPHRSEARGVGGVFFDYLSDDQEHTFAFVQDIGGAFLDAYPPIVERRHSVEFSAAQREWQCIRRGRYVEFNLIHDRGTLFGLETGGRIESILMSLPPHVAWRYDHQPAPDSPEGRLLEVLREPREWVE